MDVQGYLNNVDSAFKKASLSLTEDLRQELLAAGYSASAAESVVIIFDGEKFDYDFDGDGANEAQTLEFGNESRKPLAVIRKFCSNTNNFESRVEDALRPYLGELA